MYPHLTRTLLANSLSVPVGGVYSIDTGTATITMSTSLMNNLDNIMSTDLII